MSQHLHMHNRWWITFCFRVCDQTRPWSWSYFSNYVSSGTSNISVGLFYVFGAFGQPAAPLVFSILHTAVISDTCRLLWPYIWKWFSLVHIDELQRINSSLMPMQMAHGRRFWKWTQWIIMHYQLPGKSGRKINHKVLRSFAGARRHRL